MIITQALCNKYIKTQSYMQCGTMLVKNFVEHLGIHDKTDHTLEVRSLSLGEVIGRLVRDHSVLREYSNHMGSA